MILLENGLPFSGILKAAGEEDLSAITAGSRGVSTVAEMFAGSVSVQGIRKSKNTVIPVKR
jgi:nucleotide-binding universal stress UspA family protein